MSYSISTLLTRNLHDVFGENDSARRRAAIDEIFTEDCMFYDPMGGVYRGRDEIDRVAGSIKANHPDFRYQPIVAPEELGNVGRVQWVEGRPGKTPAYAGTDFIITRDGRIAALYLFFDKLPTTEQNKRLVLEAFDTLFNRRDFAAAEKFWSPHYIQHSAHIEPGREGLFNLIKKLPATLKWMHGVILAEDDFVIVHSRYSGHGLPAPWVVADIVRIENGLLAEHWDVIQDEATREQSKSGLPMFGNQFLKEGEVK